MCGWKLYHGRYTVIKILGMGGFGITYQARDEQLHRIVAVKEFYPCTCVRRETGTGMVLPLKDKRQMFEHLQRRFREEAEIIRSFQKTPQILDVYIVFDENGTSYYAMEFLTGESMQQVLDREGRFSWARLQNVAAPVLESVQILHERELIHRDISPDNIFLLKNGDVKLIDFGSVRNYVEADHFTTILKEHFAPPEQYINKSVQGPQTDIYALCATFYYVLSGKLPSASAQRVADREGTDSLVPLHTHNLDIPDYVEKAINKGMKIQVSERFSSVRELREALFPAPPSNSMEHIRWLVCTEGAKKGCVWAIGKNQSITVGRGDNCIIKYASDTGGVSRNHCSFYHHESSTVFVKDNRSTYGTYLNGQRILPGRWYLVNERDRILFGAEVFSVR